MSVWLFQTDSYLREFTARITSAQENRVALDQTAFYPTGGGQPCDHGLLSADGRQWAVANVRKDGDEIWHEVEGEQPAVGTEVTGSLAWDRRYSLMRTHTALHMLAGVIWRNYGAQVTGGNMEPLRARMDFEFESMRRELVEEIEQKVNQEVTAARPIQVSILPRAEAFAIPDLIRTKVNLLPEGIEQVRVVDIVGLDLQADGGTHVTNTREVGRIKIVDYKSKGKINKRLEIAVVDG